MQVNEETLAFWRSDVEKWKNKAGEAQAKYASVRNHADVIDDFDLSKRIFEAAYKAERTKVATLTNLIDTVRKEIADYLINEKKPEEPGKMRKFMHRLGKRIYNLTQFNDDDPWKAVLPKPRYTEELNRMKKKAEEMGISIPESGRVHELTVYNRFSEELQRGRARKDAPQVIRYLKT